MVPLISAALKVNVSVVPTVCGLIKKDTKYNNSLITLIIHSGKCFVFLWSLFSLFMIFFYTSNLRSVMTRAFYEDPINNVEDGINSGRKLYINNYFEVSITYL